MARKQKKLDNTLKYSHVIRLIIAHEEKRQGSASCLSGGVGVGCCDDDDELFGQKGTAT